MIIWAIVSMYWYCNLKSACSQKYAPAAAVDTTPRAEVDVVQQPAEVEEEVVAEQMPVQEQEIDLEPIQELEPDPEVAPTQEAPVARECTDYLAGNLKPGSSANTTEVATKVEEFLNEYEQANLAVDGIYGAKDVAAVNAFQQKYAADVLTPLGLSGPTSNVLGSTRAHINTLYCQKNQ